MLAPTKPSVHSPALDLYGHLQQSRLFASLTDDRLRQLVGRASLRKLPEKAPLALPSAESQTVHVVLSGRAKVCYLTQDGKQPILYFVDRGELVGEQLILSQGDGVEYVETVEPSLVANVSARYLRELMLDDPGFAASLSDLIAERRSQVERRLRHLLFLSNRERLTHLLLDLAEQYGEPGEGRIDLQIKLSHQDLANFIGSTRETVTVVLGKMQLDGLVHVRRRRVVLVNGDALASSVERRLPGFLTRS